jgi:hypothetical protein
MVLSIESAVRTAGRDLQDEAVAFVGVGAIGSATLDLMLDRLPKPRRILLCDVLARKNEIQALARTIQASQGIEVSCVASAGTQLPADVYACSLIVGATNAPNLVDVDRLRPGTIIVDDSYPFCFDADRAHERMRRDGDVLVVAGGRVSLPGTVEWHMAVPPQISRVSGGTIARDLAGVPGTLMGCILSALLTEMHGAPPTIGPTPLEASRRHWELLDRLGIAAAPLHCSGASYSAEQLAEFRRRFGAHAHVL